MIINTIEEGVALVVRLAEQAGFDSEPARHRGAYEARIKVPGTAGLFVRVGRPRTLGYYGGPNCPAQITLTAKGAKRTSGGYWGDVTRTMTRSREKTFNEAGIIRAMEQLADQLRRATMLQDQEHAISRDAEKAKERVQQELAAAGADHIATTGRVEVNGEGIKGTMSVRTGGDVELRLMGNLEAMRPVLESLGIIRAVS